MSDDKKISQLISLSVRHELSQQESAEVEKHLSENDDSRKFAELSSLIQKSVATNLDPDQTTSDKDNGGLSEESKQRLKRSVTEAVQEKLSLSKAGLLGDTGAPTKSQSKTDAAGFGAVPEKREVMSRFNLIRRLGQGGRADRDQLQVHPGHVAAAFSTARPPRAAFRTLSAQGPGCRTPVSRRGSTVSG